MVGMCVVSGWRAQKPSYAMARRCDTNERTCCRIVQCVIAAEVLPMPMMSEIIAEQSERREKNI